MNDLPELTDEQREACIAIADDDTKRLQPVAKAILEIYDI